MKTPDTATDNNVGSKTPEEIKADAATCLTRPQKSECNRFALYKECAGDCRYVIKELYDLVLYYESRFAQVERERDELIRNHVPQTCDTCKYSLCFSFDNPCNTCDHLYRFNAIERGDTDRWEFVGVFPKNTKEE